MRRDTPRIDPEELDLDALDDLAAATKALGHPMRLALLGILLRRGACVCGALVDALPLAQSTVSQHLKVLKKAGLVQGTVEGPSTCYCADAARLRAVAAELNRLADLVPVAAPEVSCAPTGDTPCCPPESGPEENR